MKKYRPVSTLPIFGKIFEKVIYVRLFGFRKNHSTTHALNYSISQIKNALNKYEHVLGIFIDLSKGPRWRRNRTTFAR